MKALTPKVGARRVVAVLSDRPAAKFKEKSASGCKSPLGARCGAYFGDDSSYLTRLFKSGVDRGESARKHSGELMLEIDRFEDQKDIL
jgi:hypothetical protein